jgi:hypothetical protein
MLRANQELTMSVELAIRGPEKWVRNEKSGMFARVFRWMDASERQWKRRHAREVSRILALTGNAGERGFWRAD